MMAIIYTLIFVISYMGPYIVGQLCEPGMTYHRHTHTCLILVQRKEYYGDAVRNCTNTYTDGHLVYIYDRRTDNFIKDFLLDRDEWVFIGLTADDDGVYKWGNDEVAKYLGWMSLPHSPEYYKYYVTTSKNGWAEDDNYYKRKFICQKPSAVKESLFLNGSYLVNKRMETVELTENLLICQVFTGLNYTLQLFYNTGFEQVHLSSKKGQELSYLMKANCNSSGEYVCKIMDLTINENTEIKGIIKVKCKAAYCDHNSIQSLVIPRLNAEFTHNFCVQVYPEPSSMLLYTVLTALHSKELSINKYRLIFTYTNNLSTRGNLQLTLYRAQESDFGNYRISLKESTTKLTSLYFTVTAPALCPDILTSQALGQDTVMLSWSPPYDGVTGQKIIIFREEPTNNIEVATVSQLDLSHNVTGLSPGTTYIFYISVRADQEETRCNPEINVTTAVAYIEEEEQTTGDNNNTAAYVVPVVVLIVLAIIAIGVVVIVRQRRKSRGHTNNIKEDKTQIVKFSPSYSNGSLSTEANTTVNQNDGKVVETSVSTPEVAENVYNNLLENKVKTSVKISKPLRKSTSSVKFKGKVNLDSGDTQDLKLGVSPTPEDAKMAVTWSDDEGHIYANTQTKTPENADKSTGSPKEDSGRVVSPQGLVYVSVEINQKTLTPKLVEKKKKNEKEKNEKEIIEKERKEKARNETRASECQLNEDKVEYCSIDYLATSEATLDNIESVDD